MKKTENKYISQQTAQQKVKIKNFFMIDTTFST